MQRNDKRTHKRTASLTLFKPQVSKKHGSGNNILHNAIRNFKDLESFEKAIADCGHEQAVALSRMINSRGKTPIDLLSCLPDNDDLRETVEDILLTLMCEKHMCNLTEKILFEEKIKQYQSLDDIQHDNFLLACNIVNKVREVITFSFSHTDSNKVDAKTRNEAAINYQASRKDIIKATEIDDTLAYLEKINLIHTKYRVGNCDEMTDLALYFLANQTTLNAKGETFSIKNGDHVFLVIGREPGSRESDYTTWGKQAVICDPWSGDVFFAAEIEQKLKCHKIYKFSDGSSVNYLTPLNINYHLIRRELREADNSHVMARKLRPQK